jgi:hypothetical protein
LSIGNSPPKQNCGEGENRRPRGRLGSFIIHGCYLSISEGPCSREANSTSHNKPQRAMSGATKVVTPIRTMRVREMFGEEFEENVAQGMRGMVSPSTIIQGHRPLTPTRSFRGVCW